jgi:hypothetical protein
MKLQNQFEIAFETSKLVPNAKIDERIDLLTLTWHIWLFNQPLTFLCPQTLISLHVE